jgi:hypothetical protein
MTAQTPERLLYNGENHSMCTEPLYDFFEIGEISVKFKEYSTDLWRGYIGQWEIVGERLYLTKLQGTLINGDKASVETIFPGFPGSVFAHWYSGTIRIPQGQLLEYVHGGYASTYERDLLLELERGVVKNVCVHHNGQANSENVGEGYVVAARTVFSRK